MSRGVVPVGGQKVRRTSSRSPFNGSPTRSRRPVHPRPVPDRTGRSNVYTGGAEDYVDYKTFDQMAGELKA